MDRRDDSVVCLHAISVNLLVGGGVVFSDCWTSSPIQPASRALGGATFLGNGQNSRGTVVLLGQDRRFVPTEPLRIP